MDFAYRRANVFVDHLAVECFFFCLGVIEPEPGVVDSIIVGVGTIVWRPYVDP